MNPDTLRDLPKALLHDHLDGGLRVDTVLDLAAETGYDGLPETDADRLAEWFDQKRARSMAHYLKAFEQTIAVMQTAPALERVAYEAVLDHAADGVVYAELRFGPMLHLRRGLAPPDVVAAVLAGVDAGCRETGLEAGVILTALRTARDSEQVASLALDFRDRGVVGFDLAGNEAGYPADAHLAACRTAREGNLGLTIHAAENDGPDSLWRAWARCGAQRIGHGVRIVQDTVRRDGEIVELGSLAAAVRDRRLPLEVAVTSNVDTGFVPDVASHPVGALYRAGFAITINTDDRLMSRTSLTAEFQKVVEHHGFGIAELSTITEQALLAGFRDWPTRRRLLEDVVRPAYAAH